MSVTFNIAKTHLITKKKQTLVAMLGVTFGIGMFILMISFMTGINRFMDETLLNATPHVHIYKDITQKQIPILDQYLPGEKHFNVVYHQLPKKENLNIKNATQIAANIRKDKNVEAVSTTVSSRVFYNYGSLQINGNINGINIVDENKMIRLNEKMVDGKVENLLTNSKGILMGFGLAKKMNARMGDRITISTPDGTLINLYIVGIFQMGLTALDESLCYANIQTVQTILQKDKNYITDIKIRIKDMNSSNVVALKYQKIYGNKVADWKEENASLLTTFVIRNTMTIVVALTMLIVAGFGIYNIMSMSINDKMKDIAILKANGFAAKDIMAIFLNQAVIIGFLGAFTGLLLGFTLSYIVSQIPFNGGGMMNITKFPVNFYPLHYSIGLVFGIVTTLVAAYLPSRKAGKIDPVIILRS